MLEIGTKTDTLTKEYLIQESMGHKARYNLNMVKDIVEIWTEPKQIVMDCMMGTGGILLALALNRRVIGIEVEKRWYDIACRNKEYICSKYARREEEAILIHADARTLLPIQADNIVFSPVYGRAIHPTNEVGMKHMGINPEDILAGGYGSATGQLGNYPYTTQRLLMREFYQGCYDSLPKHGRMILVTRNFYENKKLIHIQKDITVDCIEMGFMLEAVAVRHAHSSGAQNLQKAWRKGRGEEYEPVLHDDITVLRKRD